MERMPRHVRSLASDIQRSVDASGIPVRDYKFPIFKWQWQLSSVALAILIYALLSLTPDHQYALISSIVSLIIISGLPVVQTYLGYRQTQLAEQMNARDEHRFANETAEAKKAARLAVTLGGNNELEFYPVGGHSLPGSPFGFYLFLDNIGDVTAQDIRIHIGLPPWVHPARLPDMPSANAAFSEWNLVEHPSRTPIKFALNLLHHELGQTIGYVDLQGPVYPKQPRPIGLFSVFATEGKVEDL